jgi:hypothetical protein
MRPNPDIDSSRKENGKNNTNGSAEHRSVQSGSDVGMCDQDGPGLTATVGYRDEAGGVIQSVTKIIDLHRCHVT